MNNPRPTDGPFKGQRHRIAVQAGARPTGATHTPGPWTAHPLTKAWGVYDMTGTAVAKVGGAYYVVIADLLKEAVDSEKDAERLRYIRSYRNAVVTDICSKLDGQPGFSKTEFRIRAGAPAF